MAKVARIPGGLSEKQFQGFVVQVAKMYGWYAYHTYDSRKSEPGFPDLVLIRGESVWFVELKTDKGRLTAQQKKVLDLLRAAGQAVDVWRPSDWNRICEILTHKEN